MKFPHIRCNKRFSKTLSLGVLCAAAAGSSMAASQQDQSGWYLGTGIGYSTISPDLDNSKLEQNSSQKKNNTGFKLYGGYQFNENWALETQYIHLGKYKADGTGPMKGITADIKVQGIAVNGVGSYYFGEDFSVFAKLGVMLSKMDSNSSGPGFRFSEKRASTVPLLGVGAEYKLTPQLSLRAEYEYYGQQKIDNEVKVRTDMATLGLRYRF